MSRLLCNLLTIFSGVAAMVTAILYNWTYEHGGDIHNRYQALLWLIIGLIVLGRYEDE